MTLKKCTAAARLAARTVATALGCLEYQGTKMRGYGQMHYAGKTRLAHRVAWTLANGPIPEGLFVCHRCDNRACCNVEHMFLGTLQDNVDDMIAKGRQARGDRCTTAARNRAKKTCSRGHALTAKNTYTYPNGWRQCRRCHAMHEALRRTKLAKGASNEAL